MSSRVVVLWALLLCLSAHAQIRTEQVHFAAGSSGITLQGKIKGSETVDYQLSARGGQSMTVTLAAGNPSAYFNVLPPGSNDVGIFTGSIDGDAFEGTLPADGDYKVRVYLMRSAARRNEASDYTLQIAIKGAGRKSHADAAPFDKTLSLQGIGFHITAKPKDGATVVRIVPSGLANDNSPVQQTVSGRVVDAELGDLNTDGSPEVYVYVVSDESFARSSMVAYAANRKKSLSEIYLPPLSENPQATRGYKDHDEIRMVENNIVRQFPLYDSSGTRTGKMRQLIYKLVQGEAGWRLELANATEFSLP